MRRALILVLLGTPTFALAGTITASSSTINIAQCEGARESVLALDDDMDVDLSWTVTTVENPPAGTALFRLYASRQEPGAGQGERISCTQDADGDALTAGTFAQVGEDIPTVSLTEAGESFERAEIAAATGLDCSGDSQQTVYLCVQYVVDGAARGWATATMQLDTRRPDPPSDVTVAPGDRSLRVTGCTKPGDAARVKGIATGGGRTHRSNEADSCSSLRFTGLTNGTTYDVTVYGINTANNPSDPGSEPVSDPEDTTPIPTDDFWDEYEGEPGAQEQGGCNTGAGAAGILGALSLIAAAAAARRRKS